MKVALLLMLSALTSKVSTSELVEQLEPQLQQNRDAYLAGPHTAERQAAALAFFNQQWTWLRSPAGCGATVFGAAGRRCIADRQRDGQWPWEEYYLDPIVQNGPVSSGPFPQ